MVLGHKRVIDAHSLFLDSSRTQTHAQKPSLAIPHALSMVALTARQASFPVVFRNVLPCSVSSLQNKIFWLDGRISRSLMNGRMSSPSEVRSCPWASGFLTSTATLRMTAQSSAQEGRHWRDAAAWLHVMSMRSFLLRMLRAKPVRVHQATSLKELFEASPFTSLELGTESENKPDVSSTEGTPRLQ